MIRIDKKVFETLSHVHFWITMENFYLNNIWHSDSPSKVTITGPSEGKIGDTIELTCITSESNPPAKISWTFDGRPIDDHPRLKIQGRLWNNNYIWTSITVEVFFSLNCFTVGLVTSSTINVQLKEKRNVVVTCSAFNEEVIGSSSFNGDGQVRDTKTINVHCKSVYCITVIKHNIKSASTKFVFFLFVARRSTICTLCNSAKWNW